MKPKPYIPRPWQLPHMLATPARGTVLIVERCEEQPDDEIRRHDDGRFYTLEDGDLAIPLGPVGTVLSIEGVGNFHTIAVDLRRVATLTEEEAGLWGRPGVRRQEKIRRRRGEWIVTPLNDAKGTWKSDNPGATWGDWAWFITAERTDQCD